MTVDEARARRNVQRLEWLLEQAMRAEREARDRIASLALALAEARRDLDTVERRR